jgi:putative DNA primase/helicase
MEIVKNYTPDDFGCGMLFHDTFNKILRFVLPENIWYFHNRVKWVDDPKGIFAEKSARGLLIHLKEHASVEGIDEFIEKLSKNTKRNTMIKEARSIAPLHVNDFNPNKYLLNCLNCTIDIRDSSQHDHNPDDLITKVAGANFDATAQCVIWSDHVTKIMCGDEDMVRFFKKCYGLSVYGEAAQEKMTFKWGRKTRNGKGTSDESVLNVLGDYGSILSPASLAQKSSSSDKPSPEFASLVGVRFVVVSEPDKDMPLNVGLAKRITGGDKIKSRMLHRNPIEYRPQFDLSVNTNHLMYIDDDTLFSSNRVVMLPFDYHFPEEERNPNLKSLLRSSESASAILNFLLEGYRLFVEEGLNPPARAVEALNEYRKQCDVMAMFFEDMVDSWMLEKCNDKDWVKTKPLYDAYRTWAVDHDLEVKSDKWFVSTLRNKNLLERNRLDGHIVRGFKMKLGDKSIDEFLSPCLIKTEKPENLVDVYGRYKKWAKDRNFIPIKMIQFENLLRNNEVYLKNESN